MGRKDKIILIGLLVLVGFCAYLFFVIFSSSLRFEENKNSIAKSGLKADKKLYWDIVAENLSWFNETIERSPFEVEHLIQSELLGVHKNQSGKLSSLKSQYRRLLSKKPTWPYYYSGLVQVSSVDQSLAMQEIQQAIRFGYFETKVAKSLAEVLFYHWDVIDELHRDNMLSYLSMQSDHQIGQIVNVSVKFARIYEYCDFLYEKKHVEYAACKRQYWQPLLDN